MGTEYSILLKISEDAPGTLYRARRGDGAACPHNCRRAAFIIAPEALGLIPISATVAAFAAIQNNTTFISLVPSYFFEMTGCWLQTFLSSSPNGDTKLPKTDDYAVFRARARLRLTTFKNV